MYGWLAGWLVGWLVGWLAGWLVGNYREFNRETYTRKKEEEWTLRESLRQSITSAAGPGAGAGVGMGMGIGSRAVSVDATTGRGVGPHMLQTDDEEQGGTFGNGHGNGHGNDEDYGDGNGGAAGLDRDSESFASTTRASLREMLTGEGVLLPRSSGSAAVPTGVIGRAGAGCQFKRQYWCSYAPTKPQHDSASC